MEMFKKAQGSLSQIRFPQKRHVVLLFPTRLVSSWPLPSRRACKDVCALLLAEAECMSSLSICPDSLSVCLPLQMRSCTFLIRPHWRGNLGLPQSYTKIYTIVLLRASKVLLPWPELKEPSEFYNHQCCRLENRVL